jgi:ankyrin repeat protein
LREWTDLGTIEDVFKQRSSGSSEHGELLHKEAKEFEFAGNFSMAREKYMQSIDTFRTLLAQRPHDLTARSAIITAWTQLATLNDWAWMYDLPDLTTHTNVQFLPQRVGVSFLKTMLMDAFIEKDWRKQCDGKYGGLKPFTMSWKAFYFKNESDFSQIQSAQRKLLWAVQHGHFNLVKYLITQSNDPVNVNDVTETGETLLDVAIKYNYINVVQILIDHNVKVNTKDHEKWTPLHFAVLNNNLKIAQILVDNGARINVKNQNGLTPLHVGTINGNYDIVNWLILNKAKVNIMDDIYKLTPFHLAVFFNHTSLVELLMPYCNDFKYKDSFNRNLLHFSVARGDTKTAIALCQKVPVHPTDDMGRTPLHWAAQNGDIECINRLIESGSLVNAKDRFGDTPLKIAAFMGHDKSVLMALCDHHLVD